MALNYQAAVNISAQFTGQNAVNQANASFGKLQGTISGTSQLSAGLVKGLSALGVAFGAREVLNYAKGIVDLGENLKNLEQKTGIGVQGLSDLKAAAENNGVQFDQLEGGLKKFTLTLGRAQAGITTAQAGFNVLGISLKDSTTGAFKNANELILEVADKLSKVKDGADKTAVAVALFGKSGADMIPLLNQGRDAIQGFGVKMSDDFVNASHAFNEELKQASRNSQQLGVDIAEGILPTIDKLLGKYNELSAATHKAFSAPEIAATQKRLEDTGGISGTVQRLTNNKLDIIKNAITESTKAFGTVFGWITGSNSSASKALAGPPAPDSAALKARQDADKTRLDASALNPEVKAMDDRVKKIRAEAVELNASNVQKRTATELAELNTKSIDKNSASYARLSKELTAAVYASELAKEKQAASDYTRKQQEQLDMQKLELDQVNYTALEYQKLVEAKKQDAEVTEATKRMTAEGAQNYRDAAKAIQEQREALDDLQQAQKESFGQGAKEAWHDYLENAKDVAAQTKTMFSRAFSNMEDAIVNFVKTGKLSFSDLADAIESDLIRIAVRQAIVFGATAAVGAGSSYSAAFANGGIMTGNGPAPLRKYASGGIANSPQLALFGEGSKPEAYVPLPDGRSIPVSMKGQGAGGGTTVMVNVTVNSDGSQTQDSQSDGDRGKQLGSLISTAVTAEIIKQKRPGGLLA